MRTRWLLVGNANYDNENFKSYSAILDCITELENTIAQLFNKDVSITTVCDATRNELAEAIESFYSCQNAEIPILYYCGHGLRDGSDLYLVTKDSRFNDSDSCYRFGLIDTVLRRNGIKKAIIILDCCHSGAMSSLAADNDNETSPICIDLDYEQTIKISSCKGTQRAYFVDDDPKSYPVFSNQFIRILREGLEGKGEYINFFDIYGDLLRSIENKQTPTITLTGLWGWEGLIPNSYGRNLFIPDDELRPDFKKPGATVKYGRYEQGNGVKPIEWIVLSYDASKGQSLLISKYGLDAKQYHLDLLYPTWEKSDIRAWLNGTFLNAAFTAEEQKGIVTTKISTPTYSGNSGGADTQDKIWLLSRDETTTYFKSDADRKTTPTAYAVANGAYESIRHKLNGKGCCWWWLRSPGFYSNSASYVYYDGSLDYNFVDGTNIVARPAFILNLDSAAIF